ncbi:hypothetical protein HAZT_HAZT000188 [Hyalella azteca]|uniref:DDE Tnp4 domain-containing protein n=1 Tax=Hyalella azteca TaxID=294128 RepID=A0A6A0H007_HYAAZ|nr:hypothetical protein HAZT_HAZT000188 [Hyalella azteca]
MRNAITPKEKLEVTLRYLATELTSMYCYCCRYLKIWPNGRKYRETLKSNGISHIAVVHWMASTLPSNDLLEVAEFYNYKGGYSIILLAMADADCKFIYVDVGTNGRANDGSVFTPSTLKSALQ